MRTTAKDSNIINPLPLSFAVVGSGFSVLEGKMTDPIYKLWFPQLFVEEEDESLVRAVEEIEAEERVLEDD
jgi:hypothetical protein